MKPHELVLSWAQGHDNRRVYVAALSAINGAWDDVRKDVRRGKITTEQAVLIVTKCQEHQVIPASLAQLYTDQMRTIAPEVVA